MTKLRVGFVGSGEVTQLLHLPALNQLREQFTVTALCDVSPATLAKVADHWRIPLRTVDYRALVTLEEVDVVVVANPEERTGRLGDREQNQAEPSSRRQPMAVGLPSLCEVRAATGWGSPECGGRR